MFEASILTSFIFIVAFLVQSVRLSRTQRNLGETIDIKETMSEYFLQRITLLEQDLSEAIEQKRMMSLEVDKATEENFTRLTVAAKQLTDTLEGKN